MPIFARCPNSACGQTLQVPDQYAGQQAPCPMCGSPVTFTPGAAPPSSAQPSAPPPPASYQQPPPPPPYVPPAPGAPAAEAYQPVPGGYPPAPEGYQPAPAGPPMSVPELVQLICLPVGLFFLFLLIVAAFLSWGPKRIVGSSGVLGSGVRIMDAGVLLALCVLVGVAAGLTYLWKDLLPRIAVGAAGFGVFTVFFMLGAVVEYGSNARAGVWIGLVAAFGVAGAFATLAFFRPLELTLPDSQRVAPFLKRNGALLIAVGAGAGLGFLYLLLAILS